MTTHVAILMECYLRLILDGTKTVECRITKTARAPYRRIKEGDRIYFKQSRGPYVSAALAGRVEFHEDLTPRRIGSLRRRFNPAVCGDHAFWSSRRHCRYATFIELRDVKPVRHGPVLAPSQGLAWFVLDDPRSGRRINRNATAAVRERQWAPPSTSNRSDVVEIALTGGAIRNRYVRIPRSKVTTIFFPSSARQTTAQQTATSITLVLPDGQRVATEITARHMIRWRGWGRYFQSHRVQPGSVVRFEHTGRRRYRVSIHNRKPR